MFIMHPDSPRSPEVFTERSFNSPRPTGIFKMNANVFSTRLGYRGGARNFPTGAESSDEGAKIWFSGYHKCQKYPKKLLFTFQRGLACSDEGL